MNANETVKAVGQLAEQVESMGKSCEELKAQLEQAGKVARKQAARADDAIRQLRESGARTVAALSRAEAAESYLRVVATPDDGVWRWQGDGSDNQDSLVCPVVMSADKLRELKAQLADAQTAAKLATDRAEKAEAAVREQLYYNQQQGAHLSDVAEENNRLKAELAKWKPHGENTVPPDVAAQALTDSSRRIEQLKAELAALKRAPAETTEEEDAKSIARTEEAARPAQFHADGWDGRADWSKDALRKVARHFRAREAAMRARLASAEHVAKEANQLAVDYQVEIKNLREKLTEAETRANDSDDEARMAKERVDRLAKENDAKPCTGAEFVAAAQAAIEPRTDEQVRDAIASVEGDARDVPRCEDCKSDQVDERGNCFSCLVHANAAKPERTSGDDLVHEAMEEACDRFGGNDGTFNAAGFSQAARKFAGMNGLLDGNWIRFILSGRRDVEKLPGGSHFRIVKSVDRKQERPALVVSEAMAIQAAAIVRLLDNDDADMRDVATRARLFVGAIARAVLAAAGKERG